MPLEVSAEYVEKMTPFLIPLRTESRFLDVKGSLVMLDTEMSGHPMSLRSRSAS